MATTRIVLVCLLLASCATAPVVAPEPEPPEGTITLTPEQHERVVDLLKKQRELIDELKQKLDDANEKLGCS